MMVVVILGLLAAMTIPMFQHVRERELIKAHQRGDRLTPEQEKFIEGKLSVGGTAISTVSVNGQTYYLFPKGTSFEEMRLRGVDYILVPKQ